MTSERPPGERRPETLTSVRRPGRGLIGALERLAMALTRLACRAPALTVALLLGLAVASGAYVARNFSIDTDATHLFPPDLPWRQAEQAMDDAFPNRTDLIAVVVDGVTGDVADRAAQRLADAMRAQPNLVRNVSRPDAGPYFARNALLFQSEPEVRHTTEQLIKAQPLLGTLAADPSLRGIAHAFDLALEGVERQETTLDSLSVPLRALADAARAAAAGRFAPLDWTRLFTDRKPSAMELRRFVLVQARLDYNDLSPGAAVTDAIRDAAARLQLDAAHGVRLRITGSIPMGDEELGSLGQSAGRDALISLVLVLVLLWIALRSAKLVLAVLVTLMAGLAATAAFGLLVVGPFNMLSVAFAVLFVGLGVDFGIQFSVRYRAERHALPPDAPDPLPTALVLAARGAGPAEGLAALSTAAGFFAFLPTAYRGVSELGVIAGFGMILASLLSVSLLPALLCLLRPAGEAEEVGWHVLVPLDGALARHGRRIVLVSLVVGAACLALLPWTPFDVDPLHLRDPKSEAVATFYDLLRDPETSPQTLDILRPDLDAAAALAQRLEKLPEVRQALTLRSLVPDDQAPKLALIQDAAMLMGPTLSPEPAPEPDDAAVVASISALANRLDAAARVGDDAAATSAAQLAGALRSVSAGPPERRALLAAAMIPGLRTTLRQVNDALAAEPVTEADIPAELRVQWVTPDGRARVEAWPKGDSANEADMTRFAAAVQAVAPDATGTPISIRASSSTIRHAFLQAGGIAFVLIAILLSFALRSAKLVVLSLAPLLLAGLLTLATCVLVGPALNLANIIALPLLFGIGVAFDIYYIAAWRRGWWDLLGSPLTRAVLLSALTTVSAFGTLVLSHHPGTASMGLLLTLSLGWTLVTVLFGLPAYLYVFGKREIVREEP